MPKGSEGSEQKQSIVVKGIDVETGREVFSYDLGPGRLSASLCCCCSCSCSSSNDSSLKKPESRR